jgi:hypothetical protein
MFERLYKISPERDGRVKYRTRVRYGKQFINSEKYLACRKDFVTEVENLNMRKEQLFDDESIQSGLVAEPVER